MNGGETPNWARELQQLLEFGLVRSEERTAEQLSNFEMRLELRMDAFENRVTRKIDRMDARLEHLSTRADCVEVRLEQMSTKLGDVDARLEQMSTKLRDVDARVERMDGRIGLRLDVLETDVGALKARDAS